MNASATGEKSADHRIQHEGRGAWIFTGYAICGLTFFGVLAYYTSVYFAR